MPDDPADPNGAKRPITPKAHRLPRKNFAEVRPLVQALHDLHGPASRNLIFEGAGKAATGGTAKSLWAAMGYYGFRNDLSGGKSELSERGQALVSGDPTAELEAKQHALVATGFRALIKRFATRPVAPAAITGILREDYAVPDTNAEAAATLLIALATEAGFIVDDVFKASVIEPALDAVPESPTAPAKPAAQPKPASTPRAEAPAAAPRPTPVAALQDTSKTTRPAPVAPAAPAPAPEESQPGPFEVSVDVMIDAKDHTPEQIGAIVRSIREALSPTA